jgi:hypothetical protein
MVQDLDDFAPRERGCGPIDAHAGEVDDMMFRP